MHRGYTIKRETSVTELQQWATTKKETTTIIKPIIWCLIITIKINVHDNYVGGGKCLVHIYKISI